MNSTNMPANLENSAVATVLEKVSFHSSPKERQCQRMLKHCRIALISHASKVMLKILQARLQQYVNWELPEVQVGFRKARGTRVQFANIHWLIKKQESSRKAYTSALLIMPKPLTVWITTTVETSDRDENTRPPDLPVEKSLFRSGSNS